MQKNVIGIIVNLPRYTLNWLFAIKDSRPFFPTTFSCLAISVLKTIYKEIKGFIGL